MIKIGELSNITGVSIQTIRFYESEGLLSPIEVDQWTNYRYYDESSIERLNEISYLKDFGFSLKEIKNLDENIIKEKTKEIRAKIEKLKKNLSTLSSVKKMEGKIIMKKFINDPQVVGKWKKVANVLKIEDFADKKFVDKEIFDFDTIYFLPKGEKYWVFSWTKGILYLKDRQLPYTIKDGKMFVGVVDYKTQTVDCYAVYEKENDKEYTEADIMIYDDTNIDFVADKNVVGFWNSIDVVKEIEQFDPDKSFYKNKLFVLQSAFQPDGTLLVTYEGENNVIKITYSKGVVINNYKRTVSKYHIKKINGEDYLFVEWKSGDYIFGGKVNCYYVFKRQK